MIVLSEAVGPGAALARQRPQAPQHIVDHGLSARPAVRGREPWIGDQRAHAGRLEREHAVKREGRDEPAFAAF
jgi:hypothetical protein